MFQLSNDLRLVSLQIVVNCTTDYRRTGFAAARLLSRCRSRSVLFSRSKAFEGTFLTIDLIIAFSLFWHNFLLLADIKPMAEHISCLFPTIHKRTFWYSNCRQSESKVLLNFRMTTWQHNIIHRPLNP